MKDGLDQGLKCQCSVVQSGPVISGMSQGVIQGLGLWHVFVNNLDIGIDYPRRFSGDTKLWEVCTMESRAAIQKYLKKVKVV